MNAVTARILIEAFAVNAEIEGMKAENVHRLHCGHSIAFGEDCFMQKAHVLQNMANNLYDAYQQGFAV